MNNPTAIGVISANCRAGLFTVATQISGTLLDDAENTCGANMGMYAIVPNTYTPYFLEILKKNEGRGLELTSIAG